MLFSPFEQFQIQNYNVLDFTYSFTDTILISLKIKKSFNYNVLIYKESLNYNNCL